MRLRLGVLAALVVLTGCGGSGHHLGPNAGGPAWPLSDPHFGPVTCRQEICLQSSAQEVMRPQAGAPCAFAGRKWRSAAGANGITYRCLPALPGIGY